MGSHVTYHQRVDFGEHIQDMSFTLQIQVREQVRQAQPEVIELMQSFPLDRSKTCAACAQVFACTVGQKPSKAPFYVNDAAEVASVLARLIDKQPSSPAALLISPPVADILSLPS